MVLTTGPLDWESSALITRPLLHEGDGTEKTGRETKILKEGRGGGGGRVCKLDQRVGDFKRGWLELPYELSLKHSLKSFFSSAFVN